MSQDEVFAKVSKIVADQLEVDPSEVKAESNFANDLGADSLDVVELVMALEEEFDIEVPDEAAEKLLTVQSVVDYINNQVTASA
jgi:acyl carrier protein